MRPLEWSHTSLKCYTFGRVPWIQSLHTMQSFSMKAFSLCTAKAARQLRQALSSHHKDVLYL